MAKKISPTEQFPVVAELRRQIRQLEAVEKKHGRQIAAAVKEVERLKKQLYRKQRHLDRFHPSVMLPV